MSQYLERMLAGLPTEWRVTNEEIEEKARERVEKYALGRQRKKRITVEPRDVAGEQERARPLGWEGASIWSPLDADAKAVAGGNWMVGRLDGGDNPPGGGQWIRMSPTFAVHTTHWV